ncbi:unnamed protein product [Leptidea sinapis]|uniref:Uncharacterized protein n=1 Tax=Leptidea sinapis TaxID=189913 RepID=A0A5E4QSN5_9NEOP|nr:unnamed protein product [Leptidea sinapis]
MRRRNPLRCRRGLRRPCSLRWDYKALTRATPSIWRANQADPKRRATFKTEPTYWYREPKPNWHILRR